MVYNREMGDMILGYLCYASENDITPNIKEKVREFAGKPYTDAEIFDFLVKISEIPCANIPDTKLCIGDISSFVQKVCDLKSYYKRPADGGEARSVPKESLERFKR